MTCCCTDRVRSKALVVIQVGLESPVITICSLLTECAGAYYPCWAIHDQRLESFILFEVQIIVQFIAYSQSSEYIEITIDGSEYLGADCPYIPVTGHGDRVIRICKIDTS